MATKDETGILTAEAEQVLRHHIDLGLARLAMDDVQGDFRVRVVVVAGRGIRCSCIVSTAVIVSSAPADAMQCPIAPFTEVTGIVPARSPSTR